MSTPGQIRYVLNVLEGRLAGATRALHTLREVAGGHGLDRDISELEHHLTDAMCKTADLLLDEAGPASPQPTTLREPSSPPPPRGPEGE